MGQTPRHVVDIHPSLAADSAPHQGLRQKEAEATTLFEVAHFLHRPCRLGTLSESRSLCASYLFTQSPRMVARRRATLIQDLRRFMAVKRHLRGASSKEQRQYQHIKKSAQRSGRYGKRAKQVAARTVMKQHRKKKKSR